jgi:hypothetical protein
MQLATMVTYYDFLRVLNNHWMPFPTFRRVRMTCVGNMARHEKWE